MALLTAHPMYSYVLEQQPATDDSVRNLVRNLLGGLYPPGSFERRRDQRYPFPRLITLVPLDEDGQSPCGISVTAAGKQISETGLSFYHPDPLPYRLVIATLERNDSERLGLVLDVDWCRFTRHGWYESGGKFLRSIAPPPRRRG